MIINNSINKPNWSQLKNLNEPLATCNVTACINAAQAAGYDVMSARKGLADRPADDLYLFIKKDQDCINLWHKNDPKETIPINRWLAPLALGLNKWLNAPVHFNMVQWDRMRDCIADGGACVVSGRYPVVGHAIDHITALVGMDYDSASGVVKEWIMDDSYGDYRTEYEVKMGDNIPLPHAIFMSYLKEQNINEKRCIFVPKKGA
jgi:hypothetical protein